MSLILKVVFEDIEKSYYDNSANEMHLRRNLIGNEEELRKVLEHELPHYFLKKTWKNIFYEYNWMFRGMLFLILTWLFLLWTQNTSTYQQLVTCTKLVNSHCGIAVNPFNTTGINFTNFSTSSANRTR